MFLLSVTRSSSRRHRKDTEKSRHSFRRHRVWLKGARFRLSRRHRGTGVQRGSRVPHPLKQETGSSGPLPQRGPRVPTRRKQETGYSGPLPERGPRVPSQQGLSHGYPTQGVTRESPTAICPGPTPTQGSEAPGVQQKGGGGGGRDTVSVCQADRLGSRGQNVETSISGSCWCGGHEAQRTSRQRPPTIVAGAERRQSLRRLHVAHPVLDHGVGCLAVAGMVGRRRAGGAPTPALEAH